MRLLATLLCLLALPAQAQTIFDRMTGDWALPFTEGMTCAENPHSLTFSADRRRAFFRWTGPMINYRGEVDQAGDYTVLNHDDGGITMALEGETRVTEAGDPVVWILRPANGVDGYCWGRTDWPGGRCVALHVRCRGATPIS